MFVVNHTLSLNVWLHYQGPFNVQVTTNTHGYTDTSQDREIKAEAFHFLAHFIHWPLVCIIHEAFFQFFKAALICSMWWTGLEKCTLICLLLCIIWNNHLWYKSIDCFTWRNFLKDLSITCWCQSNCMKGSSQLFLHMKKIMKHFMEAEAGTWSTMSCDETSSICN